MRTVESVVITGPRRLLALRGFEIAVHGPFPPWGLIALCFAPTENRCGFVAATNYKAGGICAGQIQSSRILIAVACTWCQMTFSPRALERETRPSKAHQPGDRLQVLCGD